MIQVTNVVNGAIGVALGLDDTGDLRLTDVPGGGKDFVLVRDYEEIEQAIRIRVKTRLGEDGISPDVGVPVDQLVGMFNPEYLTVIISQALLYDPRIVGISDVVVDLPDENRSTRIGEISFSVKLASGKNLTINNIFGV